MAKNPAPKPSASALMGKLVGATVALPTAGLAYGIAVWQGVPLTTSTGRAVLAGVIMFFAASVLTRLLMISFGKDLKPVSQRRGLQSGANSSDSTDRGAEAA